MSNEAFQKITDKLISNSVTQGVNCFQHFDWPDTLDEGQYWFSPNALSVAHTQKAAELSEAQLIALSKWECINSFSLNTLGECELIESITSVMGQLRLGNAQEYLFHFINEENQHMWFFQKFCRLYGGKIYPSIAIPVEQKKLSRPLNHFLIFARIVLFEEIGHYFNIQNSKDERVHPFVREINLAHYNDEARHITFGRRLLRELAGAALETPADIILASQELSKTLTVNYNSLYNPAMYRDAGLEAPMEFRSYLIKHSERQSLYKNTILKSANEAFKKVGIVLTFPGDE